MAKQSQLRLLPVLVIAAGLFISACGQKGKLYLPDKENDETTEQQKKQ